MHYFYKIAILGILVYLAEINVFPNTEPSFKCKDPKLSKVFTGDTVSVRNLLLVTYIGPMLVISLIEALKQKSFSKMDVQAVKTFYKYFLIGSTFVILITETLKRIVNEARPHFLNTCKPDTNEMCHPGTPIFNYICTNILNEDHEKDLMRSFPSGHSSLSTFVGIYCAYLVYIRISSEFSGFFKKHLLLLICVGWSAFCSLSRIIDKKHHWWDVLAGATLGLCCVFYTLRLLKRTSFFQNLSSITENARTSKPLKNE